MIIRLGDEVDSVGIDVANGGRLNSLVMSGRERLIASPCQAEILPDLAWGCFLMAPFVGRLSNSEVRWGGRAEKVPSNHGPHAIHGVAYDVPWTVAWSSDSAALITCELDGDRWPFRGRLAQRIAIARGRMMLEAEIRADEPMPAALGWHPWFRRDGDVRVRVASDRVLRLGDGSIPTGETDPVDSRTDLRQMPNIDGMALDHVYASVESPATVAWPDLELHIAFEPPIESVVVFVHPQAFCVEPMTAWPDAIRLSEAGCPDTGLVSLPAGGRLTATTTWTWQTRPVPHPVPR